MDWHSAPAPLVDHALDADFEVAAEALECHERAILELEDRWFEVKSLAPLEPLLHSGFSALAVGVAHGSFGKRAAQLAR